MKKRKQLDLTNSTIWNNKDIKPEAKAAWSNYFGTRGLETSSYYLDSVVDLVKLQKENKINIFPEGIDIVTDGFPCQDFSVSGKRMGFDSTLFCYRTIKI